MFHIAVVIWVRAKGLLGTAAGFSVFAGFEECRGLRH